MKNLLIILLILFSQYAIAECPIPSLKQSAMIDTATTAAALVDNAKELNPLGFIGTSAIKAIMIQNEEKFDNSTKATISSVWTGAGANNMMVLLGAPLYPAFLVGVLAGIAVKISNNCEKELAK